MKLRQRLVCLLLGFIVWFSLPTPTSTASTSAAPQVLHVLNRLSYGLSPGDIEGVQSSGIKAYIQSQLSPESIPQRPKLKGQIEQFETLQLSPVELLRDYEPPQGKRREQLSEEELKNAKKKAKQPLKQATDARLLRAIASPRQLQEVMVDFWFNHFNVFAQDKENRFWIGAYEEQAIRPHVLGRFRDLLAATAHHPAMLLYLDNWQNTAPGSRGAKGRFRGLNENYARELMELHTLGVDGGYTQKDVITLARILTGWGLDRDGSRGSESGFYFDSDRHDYTDKIFLGQRINGSGIQEGEQALDILASHPATARHISYKLAQYFVADEPPSGLVDRLAKRFRQSDGDIRAVLETLFQSREFLNPDYYSSKFKTPYQYAISAVRATGVEDFRLTRTSRFLEQMQMPLYGCRTPNGYKMTQGIWLSPDAMLRRLNFATALANGYLSDEKPKNVDQLISTLGNRLSAQTQEVIENSSEKLRAALILGSPEMMRR
ncbi:MULTISPECIES: DUF1800 domain-containing protein [unclassified Coleofasciculus]|uniref:DUF1800 domain-containing protein n=1 Tax=unclassified Coleofasciculus TaxID=2692782 RepID=UPI00187E0004|nr:MULTISPECIES: DUF1800 domain-containing protein [unclassified Coleofasciculus]MBE9127574.1 DUF1800 domain-containing protein [Coleofasciculus sp. LEGE 07081]MBE9149795.1 DUF1800 domain-containing protein [Coleofasciculus sp. LEGE 07092]